jgi:MATE family multidrug resistance protein
VLWYAPEQTILKLMNQTQFIDQNLIHQVSLAFKGLWIYFSFNGLSLIIWGVLTAGGDTRFIMWTNTLSTWLFAVIPTYIWVTYFPSTAAVPFQYVAPIYGILGFIIVALRFHNQSWLKVNVTNTQQLK